MQCLAGILTCLRVAVKDATETVLSRKFGLHLVDPPSGVSRRSHGGGRLAHLVSKYMYLDKDVGRDRVDLQRLSQITHFSVDELGIMQDTWNVQASRQGATDSQELLWSFLTKVGAFVMSCDMDPNIAGLICESLAVDEALNLPVAVQLLSTFTRGSAVEQLTCLFCLMDDDCNGWITSDEVGLLVEVCTAKFTDEPLAEEERRVRRVKEQLLAVLDSQGKGLISFEDMLANAQFTADNLGLKDHEETEDRDVGEIPNEPLPKQMGWGRRKSCTAGQRFSRSYVLAKTQRRNSGLPPTLGSPPEFELEPRPSDTSLGFDGRNSTVSSALSLDHRHSGALPVQLSRFALSPGPPEDGSAVSPAPRTISTPSECSLSLSPSPSVLSLNERIRSEGMSLEAYKRARRIRPTDEELVHKRPTIQRNDTFALDAPSRRGLDTSTESTLRRSFDDFVADDPLIHSDTQGRLSEKQQRLLNKHQGIGSVRSMDSDVLNGGFSTPSTLGLDPALSPYVSTVDVDCITGPPRPFHRSASSSTTLIARPVRAAKTNLKLSREQSDTSITSLQTMGSETTAASYRSSTSKKVGGKSTQSIARRGKRSTAELRATTPRKESVPIPFRSAEHMRTRGSTSKSLSRLSSEGHRLRSGEDVQSVDDLLELQHEGGSPDRGRRRSLPYEQVSTVAYSPCESSITSSTCPPLDHFVGHAATAPSSPSRSHISPPHPGTRTPSPATTSISSPQRTEPQHSPLFPPPPPAPPHLRPPPQPPPALVPSSPPPPPPPP
eukprot:Sspe_Gene.20451::Locus_7507_Transcript_7_8_Confidence_0.357_Length_2644::g.20451::m.20451